MPSRRIPPVLLRRAVGADGVIIDRGAQRRYLADFSWYSPLLTQALGEVRVDAVALPTTLSQLEELIGLCARFEVPVTIRGGGTGNYGQAVPVEGGIIIDICRLNRIIAIAESSVTMDAGARIGAVEANVRISDSELRLMPTSYHRAVAAGFVAGGAAGLGAISFGPLWDGNVLEARALTIADPPRSIVVGSQDIDVFIHTYGTIGVITELTFPTTKAHHWVGCGITFRDSRVAIEFAWVMAGLCILKRLLALQLAPIPSFYQTVRDMFDKDSHAVLMLIEEADFPYVCSLANTFDGRTWRWPLVPDISQFAYSHVVLWAKHQNPKMTWIQLHMPKSESEFTHQVLQLTRRFPDELYLAFSFNRQGGQIAPNCIALVRDQDARPLSKVMSELRAEGYDVRNPHSFKLELSELRDPTKVRAWKAMFDTQNLLNPGKLCV